MKRIELCHRFNDINEYIFGQSFMTNKFQANVENFINLVADQVLNSWSVIRIVYKEIDLFRLFDAFARLPVNILVIGCARG